MQKKSTRTTPGIPWSSPTQVLIWRSYRLIYGRADGIPCFPMAMVVRDRLMSFNVLYRRKEKYYEAARQITVSVINVVSLSNHLSPSKFPTEDGAGFFFVASIFISSLGLTFRWLRDGLNLRDDRLLLSRH
ncbi:hypothetical protein F5Y03DRAFT_132113 [Xylaria venustula]|nr:hypothetical protein F5Y03DRAFT_132113 [Xylaria venustula]